VAANYNAVACGEFCIYRFDAGGYNEVFALKVY